MSSRFPNPTLSSLASSSSSSSMDVDDLTELSVSPRELKRNTGSSPHLIDHTRYAVQFGVLGSARGILHSVFRKQFEKRAEGEGKGNREPFHPYAPEKDAKEIGDKKQEQDVNSTSFLATSKSDEQDTDAASEEFQWDLYNSSYVHDTENSFAMLSWSSAPIRDPSVLSDRNFLPDGTWRIRDNGEVEVDTRVLFFTFGAWYVSTFDILPFMIFPPLCHGKRLWKANG